MRGTYPDRPAAATVLPVASLPVTVTAAMRSSSMIDSTTEEEMSSVRKTPAGKPVSRKTSSIARAHCGTFDACFKETGQNLFRSRIRRFHSHRTFSPIVVRRHRRLGRPNLGPVCSAGSKCSLDLQSAQIPEIMWSKCCAATRRVVASTSRGAGPHGSHLRRTGGVARYSAKYIGTPLNRVARCSVKGCSTVLGERV